MSMCSNIQSQLNHEEKKHRLQAFEAEDAWYQLSFFPISHMREIKTTPICQPK